MEEGPEEALNWDLHMMIWKGQQSIQVGVDQVAERARIKELEIMFEVIFIEVKLKAQDDYNF